MNRIIALVLLTFSAIVFAQAPHITSGSTVYIEPMGGYETYLAAAFVKKHVPLVVVEDKEKAEYVIRSSVNHTDLNSPSPTVVVNNTVNNGDQNPNPVTEAALSGYEEGAARRRALGETSAAITITDTHSSQIVFSYTAGKMGKNQLQSTSEACAKHLKEFMEKSEKQKK